MSKRSDPLNAHWDCLADFRDQYIIKFSDEIVVDSRGHTLVTDRANYTMVSGRVTRDAHPAPETPVAKPLKSKKKKTR